MPEGDTLRKLVRLLIPELEGRRLASGRLRDWPEVNLSGRRVTNVHALGKHLYIEFDDATLLRSHLGMHGSWHRYLSETPWQRPAGQASVVLETDRTCLVCFNAAQVELLHSGGLRDRQQRARLGPDLLAGDTAPAEVARRVLEQHTPDRLLIDLLLDQRVACGIGNVYKSELLFLHGLSPQTRLEELDGVALTAVYGRAAELLQRNTGPGARRTRFTEDGRGGLWVYRRSGRPCLRCGARIRMEKLGRHLRSTYWCPACQAAS